MVEESLSQWVSATVLTKHRSSYRKPGALMLVNPDGQTFGLISGGCLESDIVLRARRVLEYGQPEFVVYDSTEDGNIAAELGLGCNGRIGVLVEELTDNHRQLYGCLLDRMENGKTSHLLHCFEGAPGELGVRAVLDEQLLPVCTIKGDTGLPRLEVIDQGSPGRDSQGNLWVVTPVKPPVRLLIVGGGVDAQPVAALAAGLGWRVTVADHRTVNARRHNFAAAEQLIHQRPGDVQQEVAVDAAILMSHNLDIDASWLAYCRSLSGLHYLGLLGPQSRKEEVLTLAGLAADADFARSIHGPMGLDIGGDLPESVALSVIAQCHQLLAQRGLL